MLDWHTKVVVGHYAGLRYTATPWLEALDMAVKGQFPQGARGREVLLMRENGRQPTSTVFIRACATVEIHQALTSYHNPKGHVDTERFMRTLKEECLWWQEWDCPLELIRALKDWLTQYIERYWHATLGYQSPRQFARASLGHKPPFVAA